MEGATTGPRPEDAVAASAAIDRARLALHRYGLPAIAALMATLFALSARDGFPHKVEAFGTPVLALTALAASAVAWRRSHPSTALERGLLLGSLAVVAASTLESALTQRFEIGYPYFLGFLPLAYAAAFLFLGPVGGALASLAAYLVAAAAALTAIATGEIHLMRGLPLLAGSPLLIGLLYTLSWSLTHTSLAHVRAEAEAATDALTGALNRRSGEAALARLHGPAALLVIDLDDFKRVNDERGHAYGDDVLVRTTLALRASVRPYDLVVRWGGDEFVVVAPTVDFDAAKQVAQRVRTGLALLVDRDGRAITATVGAAVREAGEPWPQVFERADAAMYAGKATREDAAYEARPRGRAEDGS